MAGFVIVVKHGSDWGNSWDPQQKFVTSINTDSHIVEKCRSLQRLGKRVFFHVVGDTKIRTSALVKEVSLEGQKQILYVTFSDHQDLEPVEIIPQNQGARSYEHPSL